MLYEYDPAFINEISEQLSDLPVSMKHTYHSNSIQGFERRQVEYDKQPVVFLISY